MYLKILKCTKRKHYTQKYLKVLKNTQKYSTHADKDVYFMNLPGAAMLLQDFKNKFLASATPAPSTVGPPTTALSIASVIVSSTNTSARPAAHTLPQAAAPTTASPTEANATSSRTSFASRTPYAHRRN